MNNSAKLGLCFLSCLFCVLNFCSSQTPPRIVEKSAYCDDNFIYFTIRFDSAFVGYIYSDGTYEDPSCRHVDGTIFPNNFYNVTIPLNRCGSQFFVNGTKRNVIIVQRDPRILEIWDNKFILTCSPRSSGGDQGLPLNGQFTVTMGGINVDGSLSSTEVVTNRAPSAPVDYTVEVQLGSGPNSPPASTILRVGERISYVVRLNNIPPGGDARIGRCWATDQVSNIQLSNDQGCTLQTEAQDVWNNFQTVQSGTTKIFFNNIKTWAFPTSNTVNIFCNLHMCTGTCSVAPCPAISFGLDPQPTQFQVQQTVVSSQPTELQLQTSPLTDRLIRNLPEEAVFAKSLVTDQPIIELEGSFRVQKPNQDQDVSVVSRNNYQNGIGLITGPPTFAQNFANVPVPNAQLSSNELANTSHGPRRTEVSAEPTNEFCLSRLHYILIGLVSFLLLAIALTIIVLALYKIIVKRRKESNSSNAGYSWPTSRGGGPSPISPQQLYSYPEAAARRSAQCAQMQFSSTSPEESCSDGAKSI